MRLTARVDEPLVLELDAVPRTHDDRVDLDELAIGLGDADLLESDAEGWSYVIPRTGPRLRDDGTMVTWTDGAVRRNLGRDPFRVLDDLGEQLGIHPEADAPAGTDLPTFTGGWVGAFGYDLARSIESLPCHARPDRDQDRMSLRLADLAVAVAPGSGHALVVGRDLSGGGQLATRARHLADRIARIASRSASARRTTPSLPHRDARTPVTTSLDRDSYLAGVEAILAHIGSGDVFQVNLTQRFTVPWVDDVMRLYRALRAESPAPFGAVLPDAGLASISPETFLAVDGRRVVTRPIKGTRPRARDTKLDAALADDLSLSPKDRAENVMVVDLLRNDLGRVCVAGTVHVPALVALEAHPTVWHLASTVAGALSPGTGYGSLLEATFPCGSVTGAPKVAAMRIIERLEPVRRGWYCGAIGFLSPGAARLSVAIRTATRHADGRVDYAAGGGVVADSRPEEEYTESLDKAAAFFRAVGSAPDVHDRAHHL